METTNIKLSNKELVAEKLRQLSSTDRILLLNKFTKVAEPGHSDLDDVQIVKIVQKTLFLKFSREALIESFLADDAVVDSPGYRLNDFLVRELSN